MVRLLGGLFAVALFASPVPACINDRELPSHEREFRSVYSRQTFPTPKVKDSTLKSPMLLGGGGILLGVAVASVFRLSGRSKG